MPGPLPPALQRILDRGLFPQAVLLVGVSADRAPGIARIVGEHLEVAAADLLRLANPPSIQQLRLVLAQLQLKPYQSARSLLVIEEFQTWSEQLATVLLKTLEEPPTHAHILLVSRDDGSILPTILSRVARFRLPRSGNDEGNAPGDFLSQTLQRQLEQTKELAGSSQSVAEIFQGWLAAAPDTQQRIQILHRLTETADHPVNARLQLDALAINLHRQRGVT